MLKLRTFVLKYRANGVPEKETITQECDDVSEHGQKLAAERGGKFVSAVEIEPKGDTTELERLEKICILGRTTFMVVGMAFEKVRAEGLYKLRGFTTMMEWYESIGYSKQHAIRLRRDALAVNSLPKGMHELIADEGAANELAKLPEPLRLAIVTEASSGGKKPITAKEIKKHTPVPVRNKMASKPEPERPAGSLPQRKPAQAAKPEPKKAKVEVLDQTGFPVPPECLESWKRGIEVQHLMTYVSSIRAGIKQAETNSDQLWAEVNFGSVLGLTNQLYSELECARPYAVCTTCNGIIFKDCGDCKGRGFVSKFYWSNCVPAEAKAMRKAAK